MSESPPKDKAFIGLTPSQVAEAFPFHIALDGKLNIVQVGRSLNRLYRDALPGGAVAEFFRLERPTGSWSFDWLVQNNWQLFLLRHKTSPIPLRGQMMHLPEQGIILLLASPWLTSPEQIEQYGLSFDDFAIHDPMLDLLQLQQLKQSANRDLQNLMAKLRAQRAELRAVNEHLRKQSAEQRVLALIAERTDNGVVLTDAAGKTVWVNDGFTRLTGYTLDEVYGKTPGWVLQGPGTDRGTVEHMRRQLAKGDGFGAELLNYHKDGHGYWIGIEVQPIRDETGKITNFMAIESDITQRRAATRRLALQYRVAQILADATDVTEAAWKSLQAICENLSWQIGLAWRVESDGNRLSLIEYWKRPETDCPEFIQESQQITFPRGVGLPGRILDSKGPAWIRDVAVDTNFPRAAVAVKEGLRGAVGFPFLVRGEVRGILEFFSRNIEEPDEDLLHVLEAIGNQIGQFIVRTRAEQELRHEKEQLAVTLAGIVDGVIAVNEDLEITLINPAAALLTGWTPQEAEGRPITEVLQLLDESAEPDLSGIEAAMQSRLLQGDVHTLENLRTLQARNGPQHTVVMSAAPILHQDGSPRGAVVVFRDVSSELEADRLKRDFVSSVSHELRTPLTSIQGFVNTIIREPDMPADVRTEFLQIVHDQSTRLKYLVDDILEISRIESGRVTLAEEPVDLVAVARKALVDMESEVLTRNQHLEIQLPNDLPIVIGDAGKLRSVITNLLSNACKFTPDGGRIRLSIVPEPKGVCVSVSDTGYGIPAQDLPKIFDRFFRVQREGTQLPGTGLGLAIVKSIVAKHRGHIEVESKLDEGTDFHVHLPAVLAAS